MPRRRFQTEEIIQKLRAAEVILSQGRNVSEACRKIGVTDQTYYRWRKEYAGTNTFRNRSQSEPRNFRSLTTDDYSMPINTCRPG